MSTTRKVFSKEERKVAVELSHIYPNIVQLANELNIRPELLYRWRSEFPMDKNKIKYDSTSTKIIEQETVIAKLKSDLKSLKKENDILKQAIGTLAKQDKKSLIGRMGLKTRTIFRTLGVGKLKVLEVTESD